MDLNVSSANNLLQDPPKELQDVLSSASEQTKSLLNNTKEALSSSAQPSSSAESGAGSGGAGTVKGATNGVLDAGKSAASQIASAFGSGGAGVDHDSSADRLQIVDEHQEFTKDLPTFMKRWGLDDKGFSYDVVAVFGSQSTGKSTLLNRLFGTTFDVMSETRRQQTTKGIWMCRAEDANLLVMDVEGTDGRERGEDQDFERKSALFSMASAEVIIVNLWEHQVGLYQGANMGLLKTVFEVNLGLFQAGKKRNAAASQDKTLLLFVIRDHIGATPLANLQQTLTVDLDRLWDGLSKPEGLEKSQITDYFDMAFTTLPHKLLQPDNFEKEVRQLRRRFVDSKDKDYVFKPIYHKRIPADGIAPYMDGIWEQVMTNKDLDLPTQQELLAQFRCDEISNVSFAEFEEATKGFRRPVEAGKVVPDLGKGMLNARLQSITKFDRDASRYHQGVYKRKQAELLAKMNVSLSPLFLSQLKNLHKVVVRDFKASILARLKGEGYDFAEVVKTTRAKAEGDFRKEADEIKLPDTDWSYEEPFLQLQEDITAIADTCRVEETKKMVTLIERNIKKQINEPVELSLNKPTPDMWDKILRAFKDALEKAEAAYLRRAQSFNCTDEENAASLTNLRKRAWLTLRAKVDEQTTDQTMLVKLKLAFEDRFRYDAEGIPRVWKPDDDIDGAFRTAKDATLALIPLYAKISPTEPSNAFSLPSESATTDIDEAEFDFPSTLLVFTETRKEDLSNRFQREAAAYFVEAKRSLVSSISQIPFWVYGVMLILGWNEIIAVLRSPVYFTLLLVAIASTYIVFQLNMAGPVLAIARGVSRETVRVVNEKLHDYFNSESMQAEYIRRQADRTESKPNAVREQPQEQVELKELDRKRD